MKRLGELLNPLRIKASKVSLDSPISGLNIKAQEIQKNELFVAIQGSSFDSHTLVPEALERNAAAAVVQSQDAFESNPRTILVDCTRGQLAEAASAWFGHPTDQFSLIGITGTNGKTTSAYLMRQLWTQLGKINGMVGTVETCIGQECFSSQLTTPGPLELQSTFARMVQQRVDSAAMEVSSIALDQKRTGGCHFAAGLFTNFTQDHLDYHHTLENYFQSKLKLFTDYGLPLAVVNWDDPWAKRVLVEGRAKRTLTFSLVDRTCDFFAAKIVCSVRGTESEIKTPQGDFKFYSPLIGQHNLQNILGVLAVFYGLGEKCETVLQGLSKATGAPGRLERVMTGKGYPSIFVDYAHTEDALKNVLQSLRLFKPNSSRIISVFGCGGDRDRLKRPKMGGVVSSLSDITVVTSDNPRTEEPQKIIDDIKEGLLPQAKVYFEVNRKKAIQWALKEAHPDDLVLIAGKGHETYQIVGTTQFPFDDRQVVRDYYSHAE